MDGRPGRNALVGCSAGAVPATTDQGDVPDLDLEAVLAPQRIGDRGGAGLAQLPGRSAGRAVEVAMLAGGQDVIFLAAVGGVAMTHQAQLLEDVEGAVHGRGDRGRLEFAAAVDQLGGGDMPIGLRQHLDHRGALRRPAQTAGAKLRANGVPGTWQ